MVLTIVLNNDKYWKFNDCVSYSTVFQTYIFNNHLEIRSAISYCNSYLISRILVYKLCLFSGEYIGEHIFTRYRREVISTPTIVLTRQEILKYFHNLATLFSVLSHFGILKIFIYIRFCNKSIIFKRIKYQKNYGHKYLISMVIKFNDEMVLIIIKKLANK